MADTPRRDLSLIAPTNYVTSTYNQTQTLKVKYHNCLVDGDPGKTFAVRDPMANADFVVAVHFKF
jgi:hypothetical protein